MPRKPRQKRRRSRLAFTLLEMMAVVLLIGMLLAVAVPNLGVTRAAALRANVRMLAADLEFARQRAVMTGQHHRVMLGLDKGWYQIDWFVSDARELGPEATPPEPLDLHPGSPIDMSPPTHDLPSYRPLNSKQGEVRWLDDIVDFAGVQTAEGWFDVGEFQVVFDRDGTTDAVDIVLRSDDLRGYVLQVSPLIDLVRILDEED